LKKLAFKDDLTRVPSRRWILNRLSLEIERARRYEHMLTVGLLDVDRFKSINDKYGHLGGDAILIAVAEHFSANLRSTDLFGRYGGDEFLFAMPHTGWKDGQALVRRIVRNFSLNGDAGLPDRVTFSIGMVCCSACNTLEQCIDWADIRKG